MVDVTMSEWKIMRRTKTVKANGETVLGQWEDWIPVGSDIDAEFLEHFSGASVD